MPVQVYARIHLEMAYAAVIASRQIFRRQHVKNVAVKIFGMWGGLSDARQLFFLRCAGHYS